MKTLFFVMAVLDMACAVDVASAAPVDSCRLCRESHQACVKNHSRDACKNELEICMKHCRRP